MTKTEQELFEEASEIFGESVAGRLLASLGMGPDYQPAEPKTHPCPKCGGENAYFKEIHKDYKLCV